MLCWTACITIRLPLVSNSSIYASPFILLKYLDTFAGIAGFTLPLSELGHECIGFSEVDRYATAIYRFHFPSHHAYGDITRIAADALPDFDILVGGFPCQAFSIAGKRRGFDDTRGTLFFDLARILQAKKPRYFVFENVKGLLSHEGGRTFATIIATLAELGYDVQWQVLNSKDFGVPQNRERVFIVGHLGGIPRPEVFPLGDGFGEDRSEDVRETEGFCSGTISTKNNGPQCQFDNGTTLIKTPVVIDLKGFGSTTRRGVFSDRGYAKTLDHNCAQAVAIRGRNGEPTLETREDGVMNALRASEGGSSKAMIMCPGYAVNELDGLARTLQVGVHGLPGGEGLAITEKRQDFAITDSGLSRTNQIRTKVLPPLRANTGAGHNTVINAIRRLTPIECERLQAYPDGWTEFGSDESGKQIKISDTQRYKVLGNSVTTNVVREIVKRLPNQP